MWQKNYDYWVNHEKLDQHIKKQLMEMSLEEKEERFYKNLEFGTAGIRGIVGIGTNRLNVYMIRRINYGFADYLIKNIEGSKDRGVVIAYDNRHESDTFSLESARVLASKGIKVYLFESLRPTPELSFAVRHLHAAGGIVITASHNPPEYNGYKLYNQEGCQLVPDENDKVIECINKIDRELDIEDNFKQEISENIHYIGKDIDDIYLSMVKELALNKELDKGKLKVVFSPQHGTSYEGMKRILMEEGYDLILVKEQCNPDPDFSHTKSPNPENEIAYELAIEYAKKYDGDIIITTDPDGDRLGVMVKDLEGKYHFINGNQLGVILMEYRISQMKKNNMLPEKPYIITSIVTSEMGNALCKAEGIEMELVLTGFKYIGDLIQKYEGMSKTFLLGYEESYGYNISDKVRDKDALQAAYVLLEAACYYKQMKGITLVEILNELYKKYGYYYDKLFDFEMGGKDGFEKIFKIMTRVRENPPKELGFIKVVEIQDYGKGYGKLPSADVIKIKLLDRSFVALRPSGTEPKFKLYMSVVGEDKKEAEEKLEKIYEDIKKYIY